MFCSRWFIFSSLPNSVCFEAEDSILLAFWAFFQGSFKSLHTLHVIPCSQETKIKGEFMVHHLGFIIKKRVRNIESLFFLLIWTKEVIFIKWNLNLKRCLDSSILAHFKKSRKTFSKGNEKIKLCLEEKAASLEKLSTAMAFKFATVFYNTIF